MVKQGRHLYEFGPFRLDVSERLLLRRDGARVPLTEKAFDTLVALVRRGGRLATKEELMAEVWPDAFVEENNLDKSISAIRQALGERASAPEYVETVRGRGYRFVARVSEVQDEGAGPAAEGHFRAQSTDSALEEFAPSIVDAGARQVTESVAPPVIPLRRRKGHFKSLPLLLGIGAMAVGLSAAAYFWLTSRATEGETAAAAVRSLAVLPFKPLVAEDRDESLELGMADTLITRLSNIRQIVVRPMSAVRKYSDPGQDPITAGRELQAEAVLDGSIQKADGRVRVTVRLLNVQTGAALWAERFDAEFTDILKVQDSISERVADALALRLSGEEREQLTKRYTDNPDAYQLYLQGHYLWARGDRENVRKSFEYYGRAIEKDPKFALAYVGMAESHLRSTVVGPGSVPAWEGIPKAKAAVTKALELDDTLAEAHNALAEIKYQFDYDWPGAEKEFKRAVELNPNVAFIRIDYGFYLMSAGRFDEALAEMERAQELDPSSLTINTVRGRLFYFMRQYDRAVEHFQKIVEVEPNAAGVHFHLALTYEQKGMYGEAVAEHLKDASIGGYLKPEEIEAFRETFRVSGWRGYIQKWIDWSERREGGSKFPFFLAAYYTRLDEREQAFAWLEKAFDERDANLVHLKIEPIFDSLRGDPRFRDLLRRIGLTP